MDTRKSNECRLCGKPTYGRICRECWCMDTNKNRLRVRHTKITRSWDNLG